MKEKNRSASIRTAKGVEKNIIAKKCLEKIIYDPDTIRFSFSLQRDSMIAPDEKINAPRLLNGKNMFAPEIENPASFENGKFVSCFFGSMSRAISNFDTDMANLVHVAKGTNPI